jgi:hypothetical protein
LSKQEDLEERIREQRSIEANKKGFVGQNGKVSVVLRMLGGPVVAQHEGGFYVDTNYLGQPETHEDEPTDALGMMRGMPTMGSDANPRPESSEWSEMEEPGQYSTRTVGWHFDGLSRGMHLEIKCDESASEFEVHYKGYLVYKEIKGELFAYRPIEEWESWLERLYKTAKELQRKAKEKEFEERIKESEKEKSGWLDSIRSRWGFSSEG